MTAYAESSSASIPAARAVSVAALTWHGVRAGLLGAVIIAVWFLFLDYGHGRPLHTPNLLGTKVFGAGGVLPPAFSFTLIHCAVFTLIGIAAAHLVGMIERGLYRWGLVALLLFIILDLGFSAFALTARAIGLEALSWPDVLIGNALAAVAMMTYLWRRRPGAARS
jgi:hypothetical protein